MRSFELSGGHDLMKFKSKTCPVLNFGQCLFSIEGIFISKV
jgi:hypothetical protein